MRGIVFSVAMSLVAMAGPAMAACQIVSETLPTTVIGSRALVSVKINGADAHLIADSGAFWSTLSADKADQFKLDKRQSAGEAFGFGGSFPIWVGRAKTFTLTKNEIADVDFVIGGANLDADGVLGQNVLRIADVEYDIAGGAIRRMWAEGCKDANLAYWAKPDQHVSIVPLRSTSVLEPHTVATVEINGVKLKAMFDTGAMSMLSKGAARRIGLTPESEGVRSAGQAAGFAGRYVNTWTGPVQSFKIGEEEIRNTRLRFAETDLGDQDMLIGIDFFMSHRLYVSKSQRRMFLTYAGGPVFNLQTRPVGQQIDNKPLDTAAAYAGRGAVLAAQGAVVAALADLDKAIEMAADHPDYRYQRALLHMRNNAPNKAIADLTAALAARPKDIRLLLTRARAYAEDDKAATANSTIDLDAVEALVPLTAPERLTLAEAYFDVGAYDKAFAIFDQWIDDHRAGGGPVSVMNVRCWNSALAGVDLDKALTYCNRAIRSNRNASFLDSRGLLYVRRGEYQKAIADYDDALKDQPDQAWSLYGRGIAKIRLGDKTGGEADVAAGLKADDDLAEEAKRYGITP